MTQGELFAAPPRPRLDLGDLAALAALRRAVEAIGWERTAEALTAGQRGDRPYLRRDKNTSGNGL